MLIMHAKAMKTRKLSLTSWSFGRAVRALPECQNPQNHPPKRMIFSVSHRRFSLRNGHKRHSRERITSGTPFGIFGAFCPENADGPGGGGRRGTNANHGAAARQTKNNRCRDRPSRPTGGNTRGRQPGTETAGRRAAPRDASTARPQGPAARYRQNLYYNIT